MNSKMILLAATLMASCNQKTIDSYASIDPKYTDFTEKIKKAKNLNDVELIIGKPDFILKKNNNIMYRYAVSKAYFDAFEAAYVVIEASPSGQVLTWNLSVK